jgi:hypothetical protein
VSTNSELQAGITLWELTEDVHVDRFATLSLVSRDRSELANTLGAFFRATRDEAYLCFRWQTTQNHKFPNRIQRRKYLHSASTLEGFANAIAFEDCEDNTIITVGRLSYPFENVRHLPGMMHGRSVLLMMSRNFAMQPETVRSICHPAKMNISADTIFQILVNYPEGIVGRGYEIEEYVVFQFFAAQLTIQRMASTFSKIGIYEQTSR